MRRTRTLPAVLALVLAATLLSPSGGESEARWHDSLTVDLPEDGQTDAFTATAVDVDSPRGGGITNDPTVLFSNTSETQSSWINVQSTQVSAGELGGESLASALDGFEYRVGAPRADDCTSATEPYWDVLGQEQITLESTYPRDENRVAAATLSPQQSRPLCVDFPGTPSNSGFLLEHAGRDLKIRTEVNQRSELPATWDSSPQTVDSRLRVAFPRPMPRNNDLSDLGNSCAVVGGAAQLRWAWPNEGGSTNLSTPAVEAWEVWRRPAGGGGWVLGQTLAGMARTAEIDDGLLAIGSVDFKIVARLDSTRNYYVESSHIITVGRLTFVTLCQSVRANDDPEDYNSGGPVVLP